MNSLYSISNKIVEVCKAHQNIQGSEWGLEDFYYSKIKITGTFAYLIPDSYSILEGGVIINYVLFIVDNLKTDYSNHKVILSDTLSIGNEIINKLKVKEKLVFRGDVSAQPLILTSNGSTIHSLNGTQFSFNILYKENNCL